MDGFEFERAFQRIVFELKPYLDEIVVVGGWVPYLYKRYGAFASWRGNTSHTAEVDVLVDRPLPADGRPSIPDLLRKASFRVAGGGGGMAVWEGDVGAGEKIEFLVSHQGTSRRAGRVVLIPEQGELGAISLEGLALMRRFRRKLEVPVATDSGPEPLGVWVPTLGAYIVNKASTFARRGEFPGEGQPKGAKDLLYLRDLVAAGQEVVDQIDSDLAELTEPEGEQASRRSQVRYARNTLALAVAGSLRKLLPEAAEMLAERERVLSTAAAQADIEGHLSDLLQLLEEHAEQR